MIQPTDYQEFADRLSRERERLEGLKSDYARILQSRFHALRMLWFSIKQLFGFSSARDLYAVWAPSLTPVPTLAPDIKRTRAIAAQSAEQSLIELWNKRVGETQLAGEPIASVVIPVHDHPNVTVRCLRAIANSWFESLLVQFIVVDDGSSESVADVVTQLAGVDYVRIAKNTGFVRACNVGAAAARGKYICFLNNDTIVNEGWLDHLVVTAEADPMVGVAGSKLLYPDGRLQEAGSILWRDATGWNVGHLENPNDPRYNAMRDVDYVSGAALLIRAELFRRLGGFSELFAPAYYEDADLCFAARAMGYRVVYQPRSEVVHYLGLSSGSALTGMKRFQEINRPKFREKWASELDTHPENSYLNVAAWTRRSGAKRSVLVVDSYVPLHDQEAGSQRLYHIVKLLRSAGYYVFFLPDNYAPLQPYTLELQQMGVEVLHHVEGGKTPTEALEEILHSVDVAWICRSELYEKYGPIVRRTPRVRLVYDTVDLAHVRLKRQAELLGEGDDAWRAMMRAEQDCARNADAVVVVSADEQRALGELGIRTVSVIPTIHEVCVREERVFAQTTGLLFIANYHHPPNVDAVEWLCSEVMPIVWQSLPSVDVTLVGSNPPQRVFALKSHRVRVTGYVKDPSSYFRRARIFVAPLRFGAGMKGKIGHALQYALPVVTTPVGAEGLGLRNGENAVIADADAPSFAEAIVSLYGDELRWTSLSNAAAATLDPFTPQAVGTQLYALLDGLFGARVSA